MSRPGAAAFDFDGTVTERDTLMPFLRQQLGLATASPVARSLPGLLRRPGAWRDHAKRAVLRGFRGRAVDDLEAAGRAYAATLPPQYRRDTLDHIAGHQERGDTLVLVTASLGVYARPAAAALGFDHVIAVELEAENGLLTGAMQGTNVRSDGKSTRLRAYLAARWPGEQAELWAYGNSSGDDAMLAMADHPTWIGRRAGQS